MSLFSTLFIIYCQWESNWDNTDWPFYWFKATAIKYNWFEFHASASLIILLEACNEQYVNKSLVRTSWIVWNWLKKLSVSFCHLLKHFIYAPCQWQLSQETRILWNFIWMGALSQHCRSVSLLSPISSSGLYTLSMKISSGQHGSYEVGALRQADMQYNWFRKWCPSFHRPLRNLIHAPCQWKSNPANNNALLNWRVRLDNSNHTVSLVQSVCKISISVPPYSMSYTK